MKEKSGPLKAKSLATLLMKFGCAELYPETSMAPFMSSVLRLKRTFLSRHFFIFMS